MKRMPFLIGALLVVSACSGTQEILEPSAIAAAPPSPNALASEIEPGQPVQGAGAGSAALLNPGIASRTRLQFDSVVGTTVEIASPLRERLTQRARERGIMLADGAGTSPTHVVKGYFSTLTEGGQTTVIYVWDVYDPAGNRLHRINGLQKASGGRGEGWKAVPSATIQAIADSTIDQLVSWLASGTG